MSSTAQATARYRLLAIVLTFALLVTGWDAAAVAAPTQARLTNLEHLDFLSDQDVRPPAQEGHTTYRLRQDPVLRGLWTYAEPNPDGSYKRIGGGRYDAATNTYGQGAYNTDDLARAAVAYTRHFRLFGDASSRESAYEMLRTVAYMQTLSADARRGNFVLWMQPNGALNPSAEPREEPDPSDSDASFWLARGIWAYGEGYEAFRRHDPAFARFLRSRMELALDALDRQVLIPDYGQYDQLDGLRVPRWLIRDGADATSEAVYGLAAYVRAQPDNARARSDLARLAEGVAKMRAVRDPRRFPFGAILPWARSRSVWHAWADQMSGSLATAGVVLGDRALVRTAVAEVGVFTPHLLAQGGGDQGWLPAPIERAQIAYGADATLQNLLRTADATGRESFRQLAGIAGAWYFGNNRSNARMYDRVTGRTFDGLEADGRVNRNSGAESTIHGLLSMLALDAHPAVKEIATTATARTRHVTWSLVEAEAGALSGAAQVVTPESAWTGESLWSGGKYVELRPGGSVSARATLPIAGRYRLLPVFQRQRMWLRSAGTAHRVRGAPFGAVYHGGAGRQGVSAAAGYLDIGNTGSGRVLADGPAIIVSSYVGRGRPARLDALLVQPEIEELLLAGSERRQGLLRSWAPVRRAQRVSMGGALTAYSYDRYGRLVKAVVGRNGVVVAPVEPYGFTYLLGR